MYFSKNETLLKIICYSLNVENDIFFQLYQFKKFLECIILKSCKYTCTDVWYKVSGIQHIYLSVFIFLIYASM